MSPIEIFVDGKFHGRTGSGPSEMTLPKPPGGVVEWNGDGSGFGQMIAGANNLCEVFQLSEAGEKASYEVPEDLSAALFKAAANINKLIVIKRI